MIIPKSNKKLTKYIILKNDIDLGHVIITKGHRFTIIGDDEFGLIVQETGDDRNKTYQIFHGINKVDVMNIQYLNESEKEYGVYWTEFHQVMKFHCPKIENEYHHYTHKYEQYCGLVESIDENCAPKYSCLKQLSEETLLDIKNSYSEVDVNFNKHLKTIKQEQRKNKLEKIIKEK